MKVKLLFSVGCAILLTVAFACSKRGTPSQLVVEIPAGFSGNVVIEMGVKDAPALESADAHYLAVVPRTGKITTSTLLVNPKVTFRNATDGSVWGFSNSTLTTGDGIRIGGTIQFFVGTRKEYDAEENKKNHSGGLSIPPEIIASLT